MLSFFPLDVLDEICDVMESVSEGYLTYSFIRVRFLSESVWELRYSLQFPPNKIR